MDGSSQSKDSADYHGFVLFFSSLVTALFLPNFCALPSHQGAKILMMRRWWIIAAFLCNPSLLCLLNAHKSLTAYNFHRDLCEEWWEHRVLFFVLMPSSSNKYKLWLLAASKKRIQSRALMADNKAAGTATFLNNNGTKWKGKKRSILQIESQILLLPSHSNLGLDYINQKGNQRVVIFDYFIY